MADQTAVDAAVVNFGNDRYQEGRESRQSELDTLASSVEMYQSQVASLQAQYNSLKSQYDAYVAAHPAIPSPAPAPTVKTAYGACPDGNGPTGVTSKYGPKASVRWFDGGKGFGAVPTRPTSIPKMHASWKPVLGSVMTDAMIIGALVNLKDGDIVEVWHEMDVKYRKGSALQPMVDMKNAFHASVVRLRDAGKIPKVQTCNTLGGWSVDETSNVDPANLHCKADLVGVDMDGLPAKDTFYSFSKNQMGAKMQKFYRDGGYRGWTVPEFCMPSVSTDSGNVRRTAWIQSEAPKVALGVPSAGIPAPLMIAWYDTAGVVGDSERLKTTNEIGAWSVLVAGN